MWEAVLTRSLNFSISRAATIRLLDMSGCSEVSCKFLRIISRSVNLLSVKGYSEVSCKFLCITSRYCKVVPKCPVHFSISQAAAVQLLPFSFAPVHELLCHFSTSLKSALQNPGCSFSMGVISKEFQT
jgi:hypothetical protein